MKKRICPVCDQVMDHAFYCKHCRSFVRNSRMVEIDYYLNERHPASETDCTFHGNAHGGMVTKEHLESARHTAKGQSAGKFKQAGPKSNQYGNGGTVIKNIAKPQKKSKWLAWIFPVIFGVCFFNIFFGIIWNLIGEIGSRISEDAVPVEAAPVETEFADWEYREPADEEVRAAGVACTAYGHLPLTAEDLDRYLTQNQELIGYDDIETTTWGGNYESGDYTSYISGYSYVMDCYETLGENDDGERNLDANFDMATGELHGVSIFAESTDEFFFMGDLMTAWFEEEGVLTGTVDWKDLFLTALEEAEEQEYLQFTLEDLEVYFSIVTGSDEDEIWYLLDFDAAAL